jgi:hypothetical protein
MRETFWWFLHNLRLRVNWVRRLYIFENFVAEFTQIFAIFVYCVDSAYAQALSDASYVLKNKTWQGLSRVCIEIITWKIPIVTTEEIFKKKKLLTQRGDSFLWYNVLFMKRDGFSRYFKNESALFLEIVTTKKSRVDPHSFSQVKVLFWF